MDKTIPLMLRRIAGEFPDIPATYSKDQNGDYRALPYSALYRDAQTAAAGLKALGIKRGELVGLISDNRREWLLADLGLLCIGAVDVPRGCDSMAEEMGFILGAAECETSFVENEAQIKKIEGQRGKLPLLRRLIAFDAPAAASGEKGLEIISFERLMELGRTALAAEPQAVERDMDKGAETDLATVIFTSGTTGEPKGVMLSHLAFLHQVRNVPERIDVRPGEIWLCVLPVWHSFERIMQYVSLFSASALAYSKPIGKIMLADMKKIRPTRLASVPRIWEALKAGVLRGIQERGPVSVALFKFFVAVGAAHATARDKVRGQLPEFVKRSRALDLASGFAVQTLLAPLRALGEMLIFHKLKELLGGRFVAGISGGGALPEDVDIFFQAIGITVLEGYGLTETAPVLGVRSIFKPVRGTVGIFPGMETKIVDAEGRDLPPGQTGLILASGPQIMLGYYKRPDLTAKIIDAQGWLNTGDLGMKTLQGDLKITGRAKDTIVLLGGENIEPSPIEAKLRESPYIEQAVLLGQDQKFLAALLVPDFTALEAYARSKNLEFKERADLVELPEIKAYYKGLLSSAVSPSTGFRRFEMVSRFKLLGKSFEPGIELSAKQEVRRHVVNEMYAKEIKALFA